MSVTVAGAVMATGLSAASAAPVSQNDTLDTYLATESWDVDTASDTPFATETVASKTTPRYIEFIFDENQKTRWQNGGLVVGTYGHALAVCQDGRFLPKTERRDCINAAYEWAKDTRQKTQGVGPVTLPKQPVMKNARNA